MTDFDQFVATDVDDLVRTAYLIVWHEAEAEDLVQECPLKVARRWPRVRRMQQPRAYARRILVNLAFDGARGRARRRGELEPTAWASPTTIDPCQRSTGVRNCCKRSASCRPASGPCSFCATSTT